MQFRMKDEELRSWANRKKAFDEISGSEGYKLLMARIKQEIDDAENQLEKVGRWNWFKIYRLLERRYVARAIWDYVRYTQELGQRAENELLVRDPNFKKERISFVHS